MNYDEDIDSSTGKLKTKYRGSQFLAAIFRFFHPIEKKYEFTAILFATITAIAFIIAIILYSNPFSQYKRAFQVEPVGPSLARYRSKFPKSPRQYRILVVTHPWGGGTELFEDELTKNAIFDFVIYRITKKRGKIKVNGMVNSKNSFYHSGWFKPTTKSIKNLFDSIQYDLILIDFLQPIPELQQFMKSVNRPIVYGLHDHHSIIYDFSQDMHLSCNHTGKMGSLHPSYSRDSMKNYSKSLLSSWKSHRWTYSEILRRCIAVSTPSIRNKVIFNTFFPDVTVYSAPNRRTLHSPGRDPLTNNSIVRRPSISQEELLGKPKGKSRQPPGIRMVVMGALGVGKGARVVQDVSNLCTGKKKLRWSKEEKFTCHVVVYHIGNAADFRSGVGDENHVISLGAYNDSKHALSLVDSVNPHFIWFPALRHESYCYMLDIVIDSKYPIIASDTGSFPERLWSRPFTYIADGCMPAEKWAVYIITLARKLSIEYVNEKSGESLPLLVDSNPWQQPQPPPYDFPSFSDFLSYVATFLSKYNSSLVDYPEPWIEFLALNPHLVFQRGHADKSQAMDILETSASQYILVNKKSLDIKFFRDKNPGLEATLSKPPYTVERSHALYNRLQWVSALSLVMVWDYLARNLPTYTAWYKSQPQDIKHSKAALLIDPRYSEETFAVTMNIMYNLGPGWNLYIYCSHQCDKLQAEFTGLPVVFRELRDSSMPSAFKVSKWLMSSALWKSFPEDRILVFQVDSLLIKRFEIRNYLSMDYPFIGAYGPGVGADMRTPRGVGMNGGLSLRSPAAMIKCLEQITPEMVNQYRSKHGLIALPYNPLKGIYYMEDVYFYHALEMLGYALPPVEVQTKFSVQSAYDKDTMGIHGYDKGWYLTTAQLSILLNRDPSAYSNKSQFSY